MMDAESSSVVEVLAYALITDARRDDDVADEPSRSHGL